MPPASMEQLRTVLRAVYEQGTRVRAVEPRNWPEAALEAYAGALEAIEDCAELLLDTAKSPSRDRVLAALSARSEEFIRAMGVLLSVLMPDPIDGLTSATDAVEILRQSIQLGVAGFARPPQRWIVRLRALDAAASLLYRASLRESSRAATAEARRVTEVREDVEESASAVGAETLSQHFDDVYQQEKRVGNRFRESTVVLIAALTVAGFALAFVGSKRIDAVAHVSYVVPGLTLAAYLGRQAFIHLSVARWAQALAVQMKSVRAYADGLGEQHRSQLLASFGERVFSARQPAISARSANRDVQELDDILRRLAELVAASAGKEPS